MQSAKRKELIMEDRKEEEVAQVCNGGVAVCIQKIVVVTLIIDSILLL